MYEEEELLPLSGLQHLVFCERQCAIIHLEGSWEDNRLTAEGTIFHERVHASGDESRGNVRIARGLRLRSLHLGVAGIADVVEFHRLEGGSNGVKLRGVEGIWRPFPVEYKRGKAKPDSSDEVQLCAQTMCLEEMLKTVVPEGAVYYGRTHRRLRVDIDHELRMETEGAAKRFRDLLTSRVTPPAKPGKKCRSCSLGDLCLPPTKTRRRSARRYLEKTIDEIVSVQERS